MNITNRFKRCVVFITFNNRTGDGSFVTSWHRQYKYTPTSYIRLDLTMYNVLQSVESMQAYNQKSLPREKYVSVTIDLNTLNEFLQKQNSCPVFQCLKLEGITLRKINKNYIQSRHLVIYRHSCSYIYSMMCLNCE